MAPYTSVIQVHLEKWPLKRRDRISYMPYVNLLIFQYYLLECISHRHGCTYFIRVPGAVFIFTLLFMLLQLTLPVCRLWLVTGRRLPLTLLSYVRAKCAEATNLSYSATQTQRVACFSPFYHISSSRQTRHWLPNLADKECRLLIFFFHVKKKVSFHDKRRI